MSHSVADIINGTVQCIANGNIKMVIWHGNINGCVAGGIIGYTASFQPDGTLLHHMVHNHSIGASVRQTGGNVVKD